MTRVTRRFSCPLCGEEVAETPLFWDGLALQIAFVRHMKVRHPWRSRFYRMFRRSPKLGVKSSVRVKS